MPYQLYREFICDMLKTVYEKTYGITQLKQQDSIDEIELSLKKELPCLYNDFFNAHSVIAAISFPELIEKLLEGDLMNVFCLFSASYTHYLNLQLSPIALAIAFYNFKIYKNSIQDGKGRNLNPRLKQNKITYLSFCGFYSQSDIDFLNESCASKNTQVIVIYDASTGGPCPNDMEFPPSLTKKSLGKSKIGVSENMLLLPLDCSNGGINSRDLFDLFESVVCRAISNFQPDLLVINHSFNFHPPEVDKDAFPFSLTSSMWSKILYELCLVTNYRVLVYPHKLIGKDEYIDKTDFNLNKMASLQNLKEFMGKPWEIYSRQWNVMYFQDCFSGSLEVMTSK